MQIIFIVLSLIISCLILSYFNIFIKGNIAGTKLAVIDTAPLGTPYYNQYRLAYI